MAKLSNLEKMAIQGGISADKSVAEIAKMLNRSEKVIENYIDSIGESLARTEIIAQNTTKERVIERMNNIAHGDANPVVHVATPKTQEEVLAEQNQALLAEVQSLRGQLDAISGDKKEGNLVYGNSIVQRIKGEDKRVGAVSSKALSERVDAMRTGKKPGDVYCKDIQRLKPKK